MKYNTNIYFLEALQTFKLNVRLQTRHKLYNGNLLRAINRGYTVNLPKDQCLIKKGKVLCVTGNREYYFYVLNFTKYHTANAKVSLSELHERYDNKKDVVTKEKIRGG